jgi:hypothetical protein
MVIEDSLVWRTRSRILSSSISSSVLLRDLLPVEVVLTGVGSDIGQYAQLVDVGIVFGVDSLEFGMKSFITGTGKAGIAVVDADIRVAYLEVGHVVVAGKPRRHVVGDLVGLWFEAFPLDETTQRFGVSEVFLKGRRRTETCTQLALVVAARDVGHLAGTLIEDLFTLVKRLVLNFSEHILMV